MDSATAMAMEVKHLMERCKEDPVILNDPSIFLLRDFLLSVLPAAANVTEESPQPHGEDLDLVDASSDPDIMAVSQDGSSEDEQDEMEKKSKIKFFPDSMSLEQMINELEKEKRNRIHKQSVIAFVEEIEKAYQYFAFKEQLRKDKSIKYNSPKDALVEEQVRKPIMSMFDKLGKEDIQHAVNAYTYELREQFHFRRRTECLSQYRDDVLGKWDDDSYIYTDEDRRYMEMIFPCPSLENPEILDEYAFLNPIFKLVHGVLEKRHTMDQNPIMELQKIIVANSMSVNVRRVVNGNPRYTSDNGVDPLTTGAEAGDRDLTEALNKYRKLILVLEDGLDSESDRKCKASSTPDEESARPQVADK